MSVATTSLQNEIEDQIQRHTSFKQKWIDKQKNISDLLASALTVCQTNVNDTHFSEQQVLSSNTTNDSEFEHSLIDYLTKHAPISMTTVARVFSKEDEYIKALLTKLKFKFDIDGLTILPSDHVEQSSNLNISKSSNSRKRSRPSWMDVSTCHRLSYRRKPPSRQLVRLFLNLTVREFERENFNLEMDQLLNRQTAMEKLTTHRFCTNDTIQEYCQSTTREECSLRNSHLYSRSRSSSISSDNKQQSIDDDYHTKKKRKRDYSIDLNESKKLSSHYYNKNGRYPNTCGKVHFRSLLKSHTDKTLGDCSFLNTCFHMVRKDMKIKFS